MTEGRRRAAGTGWLASLAGALALVTLGFGLGLVGGLTFEAPGLLASYLSGGTESVELAALAEAPQEKPAPPLGAAERRLERGPGRPPSSDAPRADLPPVSAPARSRGFVVQVGSFGDHAAAASLRDRLGALGLPSYVEPAPGASSWRVRVGPWRDEGEAARVASRLERGEGLDTWVLEAERP